MSFKDTFREHSVTSNYGKCCRKIKEIMDDLAALQQEFRKMGAFAGDQYFHMSESDDNHVVIYFRSSNFKKLLTLSTNEKDEVVVRPDGGVARGYSVGNFRTLDKRVADLVVKGLPTSARLKIIKAWSDADDPEGATPANDDAVEKAAGETLHKKIRGMHAPRLGDREKTADGESRPEKPGVRIEKFNM